MVQYTLPNVAQLYFCFSLSRYFIMNHTQLQQCCINERSVANVTAGTCDSFCTSIKNEQLDSSDNMTGKVLLHLRLFLLLCYICNNAKSHVSWSVSSSIAHARSFLSFFSHQPLESAQIKMSVISYF